jgi:outer membrane protein OmpA-like peptidoglycan-associated protein
MEKRYCLIAGLLIFTFVIHGCRSLSNPSRVEMPDSGSRTVVVAPWVRQPVGMDKTKSIIGFGTESIVDVYAEIIIGRKMNKLAAQVATIEGARVDTIRDASHLKALLVTFDSGILFPIGESTLNSKSKPALVNLTEILVSNPTLDISIIGHTDSQGIIAVNQKLSKARAQSVADFLQSQNVAASQLKEIIGKDSSAPLRDNNTSIGRAVNRRVEVYLYASKQMIEEAQQLAK